MSTETADEAAPPRSGATILFLAAALWTTRVFGQPQDPATGIPLTLEERLQRLEERQQQLEGELERNHAEIEEIRKQVGGQRGSAVTTTEPKQASGTANVQPRAEQKSDSAASKEQESEPGESAAVTNDAPLAPGKGLVLAQSDYGVVKFGAYALLRVLDQEPASQTFTDHLGDTLPVDTRRDIQLHRLMLTFKGWLYDPKFTYTMTVWTVNDTEQVRVIGAFQYKFLEQLNLGGGIGAMPGTRSLNYSHPFWLGHDRVLADEFFRSGFTSGLWVTGEPVPKVDYRVMVANNISTLGVSAIGNTRALAFGGTAWWMPTTGEFGPSGAYGDFEMHEQAATRFGFSVVSSPREDRATQPDLNQPDSTQIRLADSLLLFQTGSLGPGVTVQRADYETRAVDAAVKYEGMFLMAEGYYRKLSRFVPAVGSAPIPVDSITDKGFMVQGAFYPIPRTLEMYTATSQIYPQKDLGFRRSWDYLLGANWYWSHTRLQRANLQVIRVINSANSSTFGYYVGGLTGTIISLDVSMMF